MFSPTGRKLSEPDWNPDFGGITKDGNRRWKNLGPDHYIGHMGRQEFDDTLAQNAELLAFDYSKIELRLLAGMFSRSSKWARFWAWLNNLSHGGNNAIAQCIRNYRTYRRSGPDAATNRSAQQENGTAPRQQGHGKAVRKAGQVGLD